MKVFPKFEAYEQVRICCSSQATAASNCQGCIFTAYNVVTQTLVPFDVLDMSFQIYYLMQHECRCVAETGQACFVKANYCWFHSASLVQ